ncbi:T9SS type A sorting domain-containing protein [Parasediminibacterium sp. JCM 36343]|uniref:T9SS type A sorting domain-containing protein n=1 Tax=Parasediminibacterium sp. JCM 36343 TaxID=3374279 RepID=UPI00397964D6
MHSAFKLLIWIAFFTIITGFKKTNPEVSPLNKENRFLGIDSTGTGTQWYVAPDGSDNNSGLDVIHPKKNPRVVGGLAQPGDVINLMSGHGEFKRIPPQGTLVTCNSGRANNAITIRSYPVGGVKTVIRGYTVFSTVGFNNTSYLIFDNIEVAGDMNGVYGGLVLTQAGGNTVGTNARNYYLAHGNSLSGYVWADPEIAYQTSGIGIDGNSHHIKLSNCIIHDFPGGGIGAKNADYITFEDNIVYNCSNYSIYGSSGISFLTPSNFDAHSPIGDNVYEMIIRRNICYNNKGLVIYYTTGALSDGNGIIADVNINGVSGYTGSSYTGETLIENNISYRNGGGGVHAVGAQNVVVRNNTTFENGQVLAYAEMDASYGSKNMRYTNNIACAKNGGKCIDNAYSPGGASYYNVNINYSNNIFYNGSITPTSMQGVTNINYSTGIPNFVNVAVAPFDFRLNTAITSPVSSAKSFGSAATGYYSTSDILNVTRSVSNPDCGSYESFIPSGTTTWNGTAWSAGLPTAASSAIVSGNLTTAQWGGATSVAYLTVKSGSIFTLSNTLTITNPTFTNNGTIAGSGTLILGGTAPQTISGIGTVSNFTVNNSNGATVTSGSQTLYITGVLTLQSGVLTTNGNVVFKSNSIANSGILAPVGTGGNTGSISGTVTVERFIPKGYRAYRDIAPGVYNASNTLFNTWQENGSYTNTGYGIFITGGNKDLTGNMTNTPNRINSGSGFDSSLNAVKSAYTYKAGAWATIPNTYLSLNPYQGYRLLIRGDRSFNLYTTAIDNTPLGLLMYNATRLRASGTLITGDVTYSPAGVSNTVTGSTYASSTYGLNNLTDSSFSLVTNPYVCPVDWRLLRKDSIQGYYYYMDPTLGATGAYRAGNSASNPYIQPGQAIFIQNKKGVVRYPVLGFTEAAKASGNLTSVFGYNSKLLIDLLREEAEGSGSYYKMDVATILFDNGFSNGFNGNEDAPKLPNSSENLFIREATFGKDLCIDGRQHATKDDQIFIQLAQLAKANYQLQIDASSYDGGSLVAYIYDAYTKTYTALGNTLNTINFVADDVVAATYQDRFSIVFKPSVLAVKSIVANATLKDSIAIVNWNTVGEDKVTSYTVEKSTDGTAYAGIGTAAAKNTASATYSYSDKTPDATNYYRVKATSVEGSINYSNVVKLTTYDLRLMTCSLYPNPLVGKVLNLKLENIAAGKYTVIMYNSLGQMVHKGIAAHTGSSSVNKLRINRQLAKGIYKVTIRSASNKQVVYESSITVQ